MPCVPCWFPLTICGDGPKPTPCFWETAINHTRNPKWRWIIIGYPTKHPHCLPIMLTFIPHRFVGWTIYVANPSLVHTHTYIYSIYREIHSYQLFSCDRLALGFPWKTPFPTWKNLRSDLMWQSRSCCSCSHRFHPPPPVRWLSRWRRWTHERVGWSSPLCHGWIIERATWRNHQQNTPKYHRIHETKNYFQHWW